MKARIYVTNPDDPAFPLDGGKFDDKGLTKRELFAAEMMQAILTGIFTTRPRGMPAGDKIAETAIEYADALIDKLNEVKK